MGIKKLKLDPINYSIQDILKKIYEFFFYFHQSKERLFEM